MSDFFIYYTEANVVSILIFAIMLIHCILGVDRQEKQLKYNTVLGSFILYFAVDIFWAAVIDGVIPQTRTVFVVCCFLVFLSMSLISYCWLEYVMALEQVRHRNRFKNKIAVVFPFVVITVALIVIYIISPYTLIDENLVIQPLYNVFLIVIPCIYNVSVLIYSIRRMINEPNPDEKHKHLYIGLFPFMVVIGGIIQLALLPNTPIFCFSCVILMLIFYIISMDKRISQDPLTQLNNRGQLMRYVSLNGNLNYEDRLTYVVMIDINDFKNINDTFGHAEGDNALIIVAKSLREASKEYDMPSFIGRYGGDEFIIILHPYNEEEIPPIIRELREHIEKRCKAEKLPYSIAIAAGYDEFVHDADTIQRCIQRADKKLYIDKEHCKLKGYTTVCS